MTKTAREPNHGDLIVVWHWLMGKPAPYGGAGSNHPPYRVRAIYLSNGDLAFETKLLVMREQQVWAHVYHASSACLRRIVNLMGCEDPGLDYIEDTTGCFPRINGCLVDAHYSFPLFGALGLLAWRASQDPDDPMWRP